MISSVVRVHVDLREIRRVSPRAGMGYNPDLQQRDIIITETIFPASIPASLKDIFSQNVDRGAARNGNSGQF
jgi:hypothetical protein